MTAHAKCPDCERRVWFDEGDLVWRHGTGTRIDDGRWYSIGAAYQLVDDLGERSRLNACGATT